MIYVPDRETKSHTSLAVANRTANPLIKALLRSPLHAPLSGSLALITVTGRKSGATYTFPVAYERSGDEVVIEVGWPERKRWWRNLRTAAPVELRLRGKKRTGSAQAHEDAGGAVTVRVALDP